MKNALIYSLSLLYGHHQIYAQHLVEALLRQGYQVHLAIDASLSDQNIPYIAPYQTNPSFRLEYIPNAPDISLSDLRKLQDRICADLTILMNADQHIQLLTQQILPGNPRLRGKNLGIFVRTTNYSHFLKRPDGLFTRLRFMVRYLRSANANPVVFHEYFLPRFHLLDSALTIDEYFAERHPRSHHWIPDMVFPLLPDDSAVAQAECQLWEPKLKQFRQYNQGREILFYFGSADERKGYDTLLKLAVDSNSCFIHCGVTVSSDNRSRRFDSDIDALRNKLLTQGALFETNSYIHSYAAMKLFFGACTYMILPYRRHFGSSGIMLQSIHFGRPVLVPDRGLTALRTQKSHLGITYRPEDDDDLMRGWLHMKQSAISFGDGLPEYASLFTGEKIQQVLKIIVDHLAS